MGAGGILFLAEAFDLISSTTVSGVLHGITFILYCLCAWPLYLKLQKTDNRRHARFSLGYISFLFLCATGNLAINARVIQLAYINHADFPGGPFGYEGSHDPAMLSYETAGGTLNTVMVVLTMAIQIWRLWIIWSGTRYAVAVTILPVLLLLSYTALVIPINILAGFMTFEKLGISDEVLTAMGTASYAILSSSTILVTGLIATHLLRARRQHMKIMGMSEAAAPYLSIVAMLVESYVLESAWSLASAVSYAVGHPSYYLFLTDDPNIKIIAYFLIVYRVETGRGWTKQTEEQLTSLQWNRGTQTVTEFVSGVRSRVPATTTIVDSPPVAHPGSVA